MVGGQLKAADGELSAVQALDGVDRLQLTQQLHLASLQQELYIGIDLITSKNATTQSAGRAQS